MQGMPPIPSPEALLCDLESKSILLPPEERPSSSAGPTNVAETHILLVVLPGAFVAPAQMQSLVQAVQQRIAASCPALQAWGLISGMASPGLMMAEAAAAKARMPAVPPMPPSSGPPPAPASTSTLAAPGTPPPPSAPPAAQPAATAAPPPAAPAAPPGAAAAATGNGAAVLPQTVEMLLSRALEAAVQLAVQRGFQAQRQAVDGRYSNVVVCMHSMAGVFGMADVAYRMTSGLVMLASGFGSRQLSHLIVSSSLQAADTAPILLLQGELDGQMSWVHSIPVFAQLGYAALRHGASHVATTRPLVLVQGLNHGSTYGASPNKARGDCDPDTSVDFVTEMAGVISPFLVANYGKAVAASSACSAATELLQHVLRTVDVVRTFAAAMGLGQLDAVWRHAQQLDAGTEDDEGLEDQNGPRIISPTLSHAGSAGGQLLASANLVAPNLGVPSAITGPWGWGAPSSLGPMECPSSYTGALGGGAALVLPCTIAAMEIEAAQVQARAVRQLVAAGLLPAALAARVRVTACVHPTHECFQHTQPAMRVCTPAAGSSRPVVVEVVAHVMLHYPVLERAPMVPSGLYPSAPGLWLKILTGPAFAAQLLAAFGAAAADGQIQHMASDAGMGAESMLTAQMVNQGALAWALESAPQHAVARYKTRGAQLVCATDVITHPLDSCPQIIQQCAWASRARMQFEASAVPHASGAAAGAPASDLSAVVVRSPVFALDGAAGEGKGDGIQCLKVLSRAQALEWVMLGGVRHAGLPAGTVCAWGGHAPLQ